jgi:hypothetical protein
MGRLGQDLGQVLRRDMPIAWPCACKVVQDRGFAGGQHLTQRVAVDAPVEIGELHHAVAHRPAPADADAGDLGVAMTPVFRDRRR